MIQRKIAFIFPLAALSLWLCSADQHSPTQHQNAQTSSIQNVTTITKSSHLVLEYQIENGLYFDLWRAYPIDKDYSDDYYDFLVTREGKSGDFTGELSLNCKDKSEYWHWGVQYWSEIVKESFFRDEIPQDVVRNIIKKYCPAV